MTSLIFFGNEQLSSTRSYKQTPILNHLLRHGYKVEGIILPAERPIDRYDAHRPIIEKASEHKIPVQPVTSLQTLQKLTASLQSKLAVLASFGMIIPAEVIDHFTAGVVNVHPSLLPAHRGPVPIEAAILNGDKATGVTLMKLVPKMDAGNIYASAPLKLSGDETKLALTTKLGQMGADLLVQTLPQILAGHKPTNQDSEKATYTRLMTKKDGKLDFNKPASRLLREIRAYSDWPGSQTTMFDQEVTIIAACEVKNHRYSSAKPGLYKIDAASKQVVIACNPGWLAVQRLKPANRKEMTSVDFINGLPKQFTEDT